MSSISLQHRYTYMCKAKKIALCPVALRILTLNIFLRIFIRTLLKIGITGMAYSKKYKEFVTIINLLCVFL